MAYGTFSMDNYVITKSGDIVSLKRGNKIVKPQPNGKGYLRVHICGEMHFVHRLVAEKYVPNPENKPQVNHKDGNKRNNSADNLEWVTNQENRDHAVKSGLHSCGENSNSKLTWEAVDYIRSHPEMTLSELGKRFNVGYRTVSDVRNNITWKHR